jgi:hypothetical protein
MSMTLLRPLRWMLPLASVAMVGCAVVPAEPVYPGPVVYGGTMPAPVVAYPGAVVSGSVIVGSPAPVYYGAPIYAGPPPLFWGGPVFVHPRHHHGPSQGFRPGGQHRPRAGTPSASGNRPGSIGSAINNVRRRAQQ